MKPWTRLRYWLRRPRLEADLAEEIRLHREMLEDEFVREGASLADARFAAQRRFGNSTSVVEQSRQEWSLVWIDALLHDLHFAWRLVVRQPMFAAAAILTVAFGVGANTAVVSVLETVLLNPLGLRHADGVMVARTQVTKLQLSIAYNHPDFIPSCGSATLRVRGFPRSFEIVKPVPGDVEEGAAYQSG